MAIAWRFYIMVMQIDGMYLPPTSSQHHPFQVKVVEINVAGNVILFLAVGKESK